MRATMWQLETDAGHFSPLQLQPRALLSTTFNGLARWLHEHLVSFPVLIRDEKTSMVILASSIAYEQPLTFIDGHVVECETTLRVLLGGARAQLDTRVVGPNGTAAQVRILLCLVRVGDPDSPGVTPSRFPAHLMNRFAPDEIDPGSPVRPMSALRESILATPNLGSHVRPFVIHPHCEVADECAFYEAGLVGASREALVSRVVGAHPELATILATPIRRFEMELTRPYLWMQPGEVETTAYRIDGGVALMHRLLSPGERDYGAIIETFG